MQAVFVSEADRTVHLMTDFGKRLDGVTGSTFCGSDFKHSITGICAIQAVFVHGLECTRRHRLDGRELATDFKHPRTGEPYNPDFAAMARSCGVEGVSIDRPEDLGDAIRQGIDTNRPYLIDANIGAEANPGGAGIWELPGLGRSAPMFGGRHEPGQA